ncbi:MAG: PspC domain-containing protein [Bacteroidales bacterium]
MNKTFTINLNGRVYHINDDAYEVLSGYLNDLKRYFAQEEGSQEIMEDIEARIGELFTERMRYGMQVIGLGDVQDVISIMGHPEEIASEDTTQESVAETVETPSASQEPDGGATEGAQPCNEGIRTKPKRLFRDPDDKIIAGVCSGLGIYFHVEPWIFRALFVITFLLGFGAPILIYVVLWIVIPEASTVAQKLQMRGEEANVENIRQAINEGEVAGTNIPKRRNALSEILGFIVKFVAVIAGSCLGLVALMILFFTGIFTLPFFFGPIGNMPFLSDWMTPMGSHYIEIVGNPFPMFIAVLTAIVLPVYWLIHFILVRTKNAKPISRAANWTLLAIWAVAVASILFMIL